jgi:hypothetical protein
MGKKRMGNSKRAQRPRGNRQGPGFPPSAHFRTPRSVSGSGGGVPVTEKASATIVWRRGFLSFAAAGCGPCRIGALPWILALRAALDAGPGRRDAARDTRAPRETRERMGRFRKVTLSGGAMARSCPRWVRDGENIRDGMDVDPDDGLSMGQGALGSIVDYDMLGRLG